MFLSLNHYYSKNDGWTGWVVVHKGEIEILTNRPGSPDIPLGPVGPESPGVPYIRIIPKTDHTLYEKINKKKMELIFSKLVAAVGCRLCQHEQTFAT